LAKDAKGHEDWAAVDQAIKDRLRALRIPLAQLARESGVAENTIRYMAKETGGTESPLVAIAAVLGWPLDYLRNILHGEPDKNVAVAAENPQSSESAMEAEFRKMLRTELGPVKKDVAALRVDVHRIDEKIDRMTRNPDGGSDGLA
jgi:hypothetical protein